jgi:very-short-patch-repair endonuclease
LHWSSWTTGTHEAQADRRRDAITKAAGYQTIRYQSRQKPSEAEIAALFQHARAWVGEPVKRY